ncbi:hypothetical protein KEJ34_02165 [Candidatus Bathyarchaeota archaeon]|nr:hypothetical protein [Candidatus Bathyarchaeota archaeon]
MNEKCLWSSLKRPYRIGTFKKIVDWASASGFKGLEVLVSPTIKHIDINKVLARTS